MLGLTCFLQIPAESREKADALPPTCGSATTQSVIPKPASPCRQSPAPKDAHHPFARCSVRSCKNLQRPGGLVYSLHFSPTFRPVDTKRSTQVLPN
jgi:hypothetical protein